jgi:hypothetical protein
VAAAVVEWPPSELDSAKTMDEVLEPQVSELVQVPELLILEPEPELVPEPEPEPELGRL